MRDRERRGDRDMKGSHVGEGGGGVKEKEIEGIKDGKNKVEDRASRRETERNMAGIHLRTG